ncbi:glycosyltransferase family 4 protein [Methylocystis sp. WRRC1]|uniref:glycosyltransferase family 4 protein n=1 Tax=Methylocystis sp. WRRC1 TaxID=1732014 RepID=UPI001D13FF03|nr:glycosyltransferase family 4 protein [Methylocystis sp. WRRC1]MCC3244434.1 glycosyltransferase family 4 protein [Methylocystis sp. WRRC1]
MPASRVIFVNRFFWPDHSATSQLLSDLAFHLARRGTNVSVITSRGLYDDPAADLPPLETVDGVTVHRVCEPRFGRNTTFGRAADYLAMYRTFAVAALRLANRDDCLVVKTDPPLIGAALAPIARAKGVRLINWLQDLYPEVALGLGMTALAPVTPLLVAARNASLKIAAKNVAIGERMRDRVGACGVSSERIETIANWCDDENIVPRSAKCNALRAEWGMTGKFVVGYSGNLGRAHEYHTLLGAAERLRAQPDIIFLFIGGGHLTKTLKADIEQRDLAHMFRFQPYQDVSRLAFSLSVPDVHWISLRPSMEGLIVPSKFYGVAAAGRATIAVCDPDGEIARLTARYACGATVSPGDSVSLADLILELKGDASRLQEMGHNARSMLEANYRRREALQRWEHLLEATSRQ